MKKILLVSVIAASLFASESKMEKTFISQGGKINDNLKALIKKDTYFKKAVDYSENPNSMKTIEVANKDPHDKSSGKQTRVVPDYQKVYEQLSKSVESYNNPISAYHALHLIKIMYGKSTKLKDFNKFAKTLFEQKIKICTVYLDYGEIYEKGYATPVDKKEALMSYKYAIDNSICEKGWEKNVATAKYERLKAN